MKSNIPLPSRPVVWLQKDSHEREPVIDSRASRRIASGSLKKESWFLPVSFILPPLPSHTLLFLCLAWRPCTAVSGRDFTVQSAGRSLQATLDRLDRKSTGLVPRMAARRATVQPRACRERDEVIPWWKIFASLPDLLVRPVEDERTSGRARARGPCHYFPQPPYVSTVPLG